MCAVHGARRGLLRPEGHHADRRTHDRNPLANKWSLRAVCAELGARQIFIKAHCPWQNGKVERLNRTMLTEWAYRQIFETNDQRTAALAPWLEYYHSALGGLPPISRL